MPALAEPASYNARKDFQYPSIIAVRALRAITYLISRTIWRVRYHGLGNIPPPGQGLLIVSNHSTYIDPVWISIPIRQNLRFMAWDEAFTWPILGKLIRYLGAFPVKPRAGVTKSAIAEALRSLRGGAALVIFPEGEREFSDGKMLEFKTGAVHIALNAGVPILPVSIKGGNDVWPQGWRYPRLFRPVEVTYHPVFRPPEKPEQIDLDDHLVELNKKLVGIITSAT